LRELKLKADLGTAFSDWRLRDGGGKNVVEEEEEGGVTL